jgi:hypothetical protein
MVTLSFLASFGFASSAHADFCRWSTLADTVVGSSTSGTCSLGNADGTLQTDTHQLVQVDSCSGETRTTTYPVSTCVAQAPPAVDPYQACINACLAPDDSNIGECEEDCL